MSPNFLGKHYLVQCAECSFSFPCDIEQADQRQKLVCSNCGGNIAPSVCEKHPADSVNIQKTDSEIKRWDVVAFRMPAGSNPTENEAAGIKRVVGLPGESIEFRGGNLWVNGATIRKSKFHQQSVRIPVHDTLHQPDHSRHWGFINDSGWQANQAFEFVPTVDKNEIQWFSYLNQRNYSYRADEIRRNKSFPIEDFYAFNQSLSRDLNPMDDVFFAMDARTSAGSTFAWQFNHRGTWYEFQIDTEDLVLKVTSTGTDLEPTNIAMDADTFGDPVTRIEFSSFDLQLMVWVNGKEVFQSELAESEKPVSDQLLMFGAAKSPLVLDRIQIWRDLYYFPAPGDPSPYVTTVSQNGYFVIGDNVPTSIDSRHWRTPSLPRSNVIGSVKLP